MSLIVLLLFVFIAFVYSQETCKHNSLSENEASVLELKYLLTLAEISQASYNITLIKQYDNPVIYEYDGYLAFTTNITVNHPKEGLINAFVVAYQGTHNPHDVLVDIESIETVDFHLNSSELVGKAGKGFVDYYENIIYTKPSTNYTSNRIKKRNLLEKAVDKVKEIISSFNKPKINNNSLLNNIVEATKTFKYVIITGHSLGGAVAHLSAIDLFKSFSISHDFKVLLATFGSPRTFEKHTALRILDSISIENYRVVNSYDPIPLLPPPDLLISQFHHIGLPIGYDYDQHKWIKSNDYDFGGFHLSLDVDSHLFLGDKGYFTHLNKTLELNYCV